MSRLSVLERIVLLLGLTKFENTKCRWQFAMIKNTEVNVLLKTFVFQG